MSEKQIEVAVGNDKELCCAECKFFRDHYNAEGMGDCRRHAPRPRDLTKSSFYDWGFPQVPDTYWCGELEGIK